ACRTYRGGQRRRQDCPIASASVALASVWGANAHSHWGRPDCWLCRLRDWACQVKRGETQTITTPTVQALNQMPGCRAFRMNAGKWKVRNGWVHGAEEGTADVIGWIWGRFFAIETKTPEGDLKPK